VSDLTDTGNQAERRPRERLAVVAFTSRPAVRALFSEIAREEADAISMHHAALEAAAVDSSAAALAEAGVAVVDASADHAEAIAVCGGIHALRPGLPVSAVFCCAHSATVTGLRALIAAGVEGIVDLQLSPADTVRVLRGVARGQGAFHLQLAAGPSSSLAELLTSGDAARELSDHDLGLLRMVAAGLTDHEIGQKLYLSHHTVKHRIDRLRRRVQARNRIQLAAWAGSQEALRSAGDPRSDGRGTSGVPTSTLGR
jgi:two-component system, NarL family, response regulator DevR